MDSSSLRSSSPRSTRPLSTAFPTRTSSRASSTSCLSTQSSSRSLNSLAHASANASGRFTPGGSSVYGAAPDWERDGDAPDNDTTPSVGQGEWGSSSNRAQARQYEDTSSLHSVETPSIRSLSPSPRLASSRTPGPSSPNPNHPYGNTLRLIPRSPLNERAPPEDRAFFKEMGGSGSEDDRWAETESTHSGTSIRNMLQGGTGTSIRSQRLREDSEKTAHQMDIREGLDRPPLDTRGSSSDAVSVSSSGEPLYLGAPSPSSLLDRNFQPRDDADTTSLASVRSTESGSAAWLQGATESSSGHGSIGQGSMGGGAKERDRDSLRPRQRELREWSQACWVWQREKMPWLGTGMLSKAPLIREVSSRRCWSWMARRGNADSMVVSRVRA
jgi:hypothetical protein